MCQYRRDISEATFCFRAPPLSRAIEKNRLGKRKHLGGGFGCFYFTRLSFGVGVRWTRFLYKFKAYINCEIGNRVAQTQRTKLCRMCVRNGLRTVFVIRSTYSAHWYKRVAQECIFEPGVKRTRQRHSCCLPLTSPVWRKLFTVDRMTREFLWHAPPDTRVPSY